MRLSLRGTWLRDDEATMADLGVQAGDMFVADRSTSVSSNVGRRPKVMLGEILALRDDVFSSFFQLLEVLPEPGQSDLWQMLMVLPTLAPMADMFRDPNPSAWREVMGTYPPLKLVYSLQIVDSLLIPNNDDAAEDAAAWRVAFLEAGGLQLVDSLLRKYDVTVRGWTTVCVGCGCVAVWLCGCGCVAVCATWIGSCLTCVLWAGYLWA